MPDTEATRTDMRFASKYLENKQFNEARQYVTSARRKDPDVTLAVKTESKDVAFLTPNSLEADILAQQSFLYAEEVRTLTAEQDKLYAESIKAGDRNLAKIHKMNDAEAMLQEMDRQEIERKYEDRVYEQRMSESSARIDCLRSEITSCLQQAIKLNPAVPNYYASLGRAYLDQKHFDNAVELLTIAQKRWPEHFEIRRALDSALKPQQLQHSLETAPPTYSPSIQTPTNWRLRFILAGIVLFFISAVFATSTSNPLSAVGGLGAIGLIFVGWKLM